MAGSDEKRPAPPALPSPDDWPATVPSPTPSAAAESVAPQTLLKGSGTTAKPLPQFKPGDVLAGRYVIERFIARGGMGEVYQALDRELGTHLALKALALEHLGSQETIDMLKRELVLARMVTHPNVCRLFDFEFHDASPTEGFGVVHVFLTMELLEGKTLAEYVREKGRLSPREALPLAEQLVEGLGAAHAAGVIHRDFKTQNVILVPRRPGEPPRAVITDFGVAGGRAASGPDTSSLTLQGRAFGTPLYMAPEQVDGGTTTPATDIYSLGIVLYEMVTGTWPFKDGSPLTIATQRLARPPPSPRSVVADLDRSWEKAILRCLERKPSARFASTADVVRALRGESVPGAASLRRTLMLGLAVAALGLAVMALRTRTGNGVATSASTVTEGAGGYVERRIPESSNPFAVGASKDGRLFYENASGVWVRAPRPGRPSRVSLPAGALHLVDVFPDGKHFLVREGEVLSASDKKLGVLDLDTGSLDRLPLQASSASVSPDGKQLFCLGGYEQFTFDLGRRTRRWLRDAADDYGASVAWAPDGRFVALFVGNPSTNAALALAAVSTDDGSMQVLVQDPELLQAGGAVAVAWPRADQVLFARTSREGGAEQAEVWTLPVAGGARSGEPRRLHTSAVTAIDKLVPTPSGVVFAGGLIHADVHLATLLEGDTRLGPDRALTRNDGNNRPSDWTEGGQILFASDRSGTWNIYSEAPDSPTATSLTAEATCDTWPISVQAHGVLFWRMTGDGQGIARKCDLARLDWESRTVGVLFSLDISPTPVSKAARPPPDGLGVHCSHERTPRCVLSEAKEAAVEFSWFDPVSGRRGGHLSTASLDGDATKTKPAWDLAPDGSALAVALGGPRLRVISTDSGRGREITIDAGPGDLQYLAWSADGKHLFASGMEFAKFRYSLFSVDLSGKTSFLITSDHAWLAQPTPSPDARQLAFLSMDFDSTLWSLEKQ